MRALAGVQIEKVKKLSSLDKMLLVTSTMHVGEVLYAIVMETKIGNLLMYIYLRKYHSEFSLR